MNFSSKIIGVIGGSVCGEEEYELSREVGKLIAKNRAILICGGMGGVMEAACKGAKESGGITVGVLPTFERESANPYVQIPVVTGMGIGRNIIIVRSAQSIIAINGKYGTLSEIAYALQLEKPVIALKPWVEIPGMKIVQNPEEAVKLALSLAK